MQCFTLVPSFVSLLTADLYDSCITRFSDDVIVDDVGGQEVSNLSLLCPLLYHSCITLPSSYLPAGHLYSQPTIGHFHSDWDKIFVVEILQNAINDITQTFTRILIKETKHIWQVSVPNLMFQRSWMIFVRQEDRFGKSLERAIPQIPYDIIKKNRSNPYNRKKNIFFDSASLCSKWYFWGKKTALGRLLSGPIPLTVSGPTITSSNTIQRQKTKTIQRQKTNTR